MSVPCDHVDVWLGRFVDGELKGRARRNAEAHVAECCACQARIDEFRELGESLRDALGAELGAPLGGRALELEERIRDGVGRSGVSGGAGPSTAWQLSAAAALLALAVGGAFLALRSGGPAQDAAPLAFEEPFGASTQSASFAPQRDPVVVRVLPSGHAATAARVMETGDADFGVVWIGDHEAPP